MVAQKFGKSDPDLGSRVGKRRGTKEISDKPLNGPGSDVAISAKVGGVSNKKANTSSKKGASK
jgi:hypothetical protein